ncbi:MAG: hypothetical protein HOP26_03880 [Methylotenera sp.]|nr:hypothetical protein [Methylotenera sp.]NOU39801.1 hypothetical protein [Methylotenera sp.]
MKTFTMKQGFLMTSCFIASSLAVAGQMNAIPTCYNAKITAPNENVETELFVIIDQTTPFDARLKQAVAENVRPFLQSNHAFSVTQFSAFTQGHYTEVLVSGKLDATLAQKQRDDISKPVLAKYDQCIALQTKQASRLLGGAMKSSFSADNSTITKSDVFASLKDISSKVKQSKADTKVVLIASDMLENSSITSFYAKQAVRQINPEKELKLAEDSQMFADFAGAKVYVIGAGLLAEDAKQAKGVYRSPQIMQALATFWKAWFHKSNAELIEFGQPALLNPVR